MKWRATSLSSTVLTPLHAARDRIKASLAAHKIQSLLRNQSKK
jgi:hypothetical protein